MSGTAARVLDYAAVWVHADGSSSMLEHEIIRIQSPEGIDRFAEHPRLRGQILKMRVIKADGRSLEPESISQKRTVTLPHLEVGDYVETEQIVRENGTGPDHYLGPLWYFREANIAYARSEFVIISPTIKALVVEVHGDVPAPVVHTEGPLTVKRYRMDFSPAAPTEELSPPAEEFLPNLQIGWGLDADLRAQVFSDKVRQHLPLDPRIARIAQQITKAHPESAVIQRARTLYRWVVSNIEEGGESDARRVIVGKSGNRWLAYVHLCRTLGIPVNYGIAENRLAAPPQGPISEMHRYQHAVLKVGRGKKARWLTIGSKHAPFGYLPAEVRGMPAMMLLGNSPVKQILPTAGTADGIAVDGSGTINTQGSAELSLVQRFAGKHGMQLRTGLTKLSEAQHHDVIESRLLGPSLRGAQLLSHELAKLDDHDGPIEVRTESKVGQFANRRGSLLLLRPPFRLNLARLAKLPHRETPILIGQSTHQTLRLVLKLPSQSRVKVPAPREFYNGPRRVLIRDRVEGKSLILEREIHLPAGRIQPDEYQKFLEFTRSADDALAHEFTIELDASGS